MNETGLPIPPAQEIQRITEGVLRRPEFNRLNETTERQLRWLDRLLRWPGSVLPFELGPSGSFILKALLILLLAALVYYLVRLLLSGSGRLMLSSRTGRLKAATLQERAPSREELKVSLDRAEQALSGGDLRSAIRILYRAFIDLLAERGLLNLARWKTSLAYLRECPLHSEQYPLLQELTAAYNTIVYGHYPYEKEKIAHFLSELRSQGGQG